jgi:integrase/recombinase XerD
MARAKRNEPLTVYPSRRVLDLYVRYIIEELNGLDAEHLPDYVFINLWEGGIGRPLAYPAVTSLFGRLSKRVAKDTGVAFRATPHMLRHTRATEWIRDDKLPVPTVSRLLGHTSIQTTTDIYVHLTAADMRADLEAARGRGGGTV